MDAKYITPFLESVKTIMGQFGFEKIERGTIVKKENMNVDMDTIAIVGLVGGVKGNVSYAFSEETAKSIASKMMMGMTVNDLDEMARSAMSEFANMITGTAIATLSQIEEISEVTPTPPSIIYGKEIYMIITPMETLAIDLETDVGKIEVNIGLEM
ncbi:chemotaxis protein CheX [Tindallia californiensis]|uniref:Chemotaxis protein CheX n=1 Tax=Tindallia californiensis TaxID=159292 RepID=A0A1H3I608_9FIRM|nr:chemotaxis protein CheX [Tindallia californiensis]SDY22548.1 chemotaxis protein CheX [Tindallia californiensis]